MRSTSKARPWFAMCSIALSVIVGGATACSGGSGSGSGGNLIESIKSSNQMTIGTSNDAPWSTVSDSGEALGIVPDILREFLHRAGIDATIKSTAMPFDSLIPSVGSDRIDVIGDAIFATEERAKQVNFTRTIFVNPEGLVVRAGNPDNLVNLSDLCGRTGATYKGTSWAEDLKKASAQCPDGKSINVKVYTTVFEVMQDIAAGRVDGGLVDASITEYAISKNPALGVELAPGYVSPNRSASQNALAVNRSDNSFAEAFNPIYTQMLDDGTVGKILAKWGLTSAKQFLPD